MIKMAVVVLNWKGAEDTVACLRSLFAGTTVPHSVVVVDNASSDGSIERIVYECDAIGVTIERQKYDSIVGMSTPTWELPERGVLLVEADRNLGFCMGNNLGTELAFACGADACLILNNDTEVAPDLLGELSAAAVRNGPRVLISPQVLYADGSDQVWWCGGSFAFGLRPVYLRQREEMRPSVTGDFSTDWVTGCATLISKELFAEIGLYDPVFFIWCEEWDLSLRAKQLGVPMIVVPAAIVRHKVGKSLGTVSPLTFFYSQRNMRLLRQRYLTGWSRVLLSIPYYPVKALQAAVYAWRYRSTKYLHAYVDAMTSQGGVWKRQ